MSDRFCVLLTDRAWPDTVVEREILETIGARLVEPPTRDEATLCRLAADADAIAVNWAPVSAAVIRSGTRLRVICRTGIGLDNIDVAEATRRRIPVTNVPDYCVAEVADHTLALALACARQIGFYHHRAKRGEYCLEAGGTMRRLAGQSFGLVGLGRIGRNLVPKLKTLGFRVMAHTPSGNDHGTGCAMVSLDTLLAESDFVSLHAPLDESTRHIIGERALRLMKPTAWLINTSRGGLVDTQALSRALAENRLAGAALDVFDPEPPDLGDPLYRDERVIVTPHAAFVSRESLIELRTRVARQIVDVLSGRPPEHVVNPAACAVPAR